MRILSRRRSLLPRIIAGVLVAVMSPIAAFAVSGNLEHIPGAFNAAVDYIRAGNGENPEILSVSVSAINNGTLMLYSPIFSEDSYIPSAGEPELPAVQEILPALEETGITALPVMSQNISVQRDDLSRFNSNTGTVLQQTFQPRRSIGSGVIQLDGGGQIRNRTNIDDSRILSESRLPINWQPVRSNNKSEPQVLIYHTHTTESFRLSDGEYYDPKYIFRTVDSDKNIVAVGAAIAEEIAKMGFGVIHDGTLHDYPVFRGAYARSADTVRAILREYPSIKVVLDVHRDGIESGGMPVAAVAEVDGKEAAQIMIVSPADNGNWGIPNFMENFRFASQLQSQMEQESPGLTRAILFQYCNYNLHLSPGALLIEVGSHGNTLEQAIYGGRLFGQSLGRLLTELAIEESG